MITKNAKTELLTTMAENDITLDGIQCADVFFDDGTNTHIQKCLDDDPGAFLEAIDRPYGQLPSAPPDCFYTFQTVYGRVWLADGRWLNRVFDMTTETESWSIRSDATEIPSSLDMKK